MVRLSSVFEKEEEKVEPKDSVAVDVNMNDVVVRKGDTHYVRIPTRLHYHFKSLAENLQKKYSKRWKENKRILYRVRYFHQKAKLVMEGLVRKVGC